MHINHRRNSISDYNYRDSFSNKYNKRFANRQFRAKVKSLMRSNKYEQAQSAISRKAKSWWD